ncbi:BTB/POZ domain-containing protein NPY1 [Linum perenne]
MKFMKLGFKPDAFLAQGKSIRYVSSELATDVTINVGEVQFYLHKFPLLSKSSRLQKLVAEASEANSDEINIVEFPGGYKAFEICAKFCYGMTVTLNAYNVVAARCAAEYLEMTEDVDSGNLIFKIEVFLNSSIFRSWKDSIIVLQTTKSLLPWSDELKIVGRCIDSIASKTSIDPSTITWSYTYNRKLNVVDGEIVEDDGHHRFQKRNNHGVPKDWWVEDACELEIDLYKRVILAVKSKGRMDCTVMGEALNCYALRWLPDSVNDLTCDASSSWHKYLIETLVHLLPSEKATGCSCSLLLKLLKVGIFAGLNDTLKEDLVKRVSLKLQDASVKDLLIPAQSPQSTRYDVGLVKSIVNHFLTNGKHCQELSIEKNGGEVERFLFPPEHRSLMHVGQLIDGYLAEIAHDANVSLDSFIDLSRSIPDTARPIHDGLYMAIDIYLKEHPGLSKDERKKVCSLLDVKKLTMNASMHAAQNDSLPLRVVVQVLFFEQVRAAANARNYTSNVARTNTGEEYEKVGGGEEGCKQALEKQMSLKLKLATEEEEVRLMKKNSSKNSKSGMQLLPSRSRRIFDKLWSVGRGGNVESKSSETSGSSESPPSMAPGDTKSSGSSSRHRRHSIS